MGRESLIKFSDILSKPNDFVLFRCLIVSMSVSGWMGWGGKRESHY